MGFTFDIQMANIVAYLTTSSRTPPRVSYPELSSFLGILSGVEPGPEGVFSETLVSSSPDWVIAVKQTARLAWNDLTNQPDWSKQVPESEITARLATIRGLLSDYHLFGLAVGSWQDDQQLRAFINYAAFDSGHNAPFLVPRAGMPIAPLSYLIHFRRSRWRLSAHRIGRGLCFGHETPSPHFHPYSRPRISITS
jgi:hypothetical protein